MSKRTYGHVLVLLSRRLVRSAADDDFSTKRVLRFTMFHIISLQTAHNITEI